MRIGFYAPLKAPHHPVPSGDRQMARNLIAALSHAGHAVELLSDLRAYSSESQWEARRRIAAEAGAETERIAETWARRPAATPDIILAYHLYYKAPDLVGLPLAQRFGLPYLTAEASHAAKRASGPWQKGHAAVERAIRAAALNLCFTPTDRAGLAALVRPERLADLPPFIDTADFGPRDPGRPGPGPVRLATVAMMREGDKHDSYAILAEALGRCRTLDWHLSIVGDGPDRPAVEAAFAGLPADRLAWHGALAAPAVGDVLRRAELFAWPGVNEAFGLCYLEASACGLPVVAIRGRGTPSVVRHGQTGLLTGTGPEAFGAGLASLIENAGLRERLGAEGARLVHHERTVAAAAVVLDAALRGVLAGHDAKAASA